MKIKKINQSAGVVASVVDSLTSNSTTDALSAKQGKELKNLIDNIEVVGGGLDSLPINTIIKYDGTEIPEGWEEVHEINIITARTNNNSSAVIETAMTVGHGGNFHRDYNTGAISGSTSQDTNLKITKIVGFELI